jgi:hypothetical protein
LTIQGQAIAIPSGAAQATHLSAPLPPEIAFLVRHGVSMQVLRQAAWIAESVGVTADQALTKGDLLNESTSTAPSPAN